MTDRFTITIDQVFEGNEKMTLAWKWAKAYLKANGGELCVEVFVKRTRDQEKLYHSCFKDLARDCLYAGQKVDEEVWKRGLLQAFFEATRHDPEYAQDWMSRAPRLIPCLDSDEMLMIPIESKRFTKRLASAFISFVHSEGDRRGVKWSKTSLGRGVPEEVAA